MENSKQASFKEEELEWGGIEMKKKKKKTTVD